MSDTQAIVLLSIMLVFLSSIVAGTVGALISTRRSVEVRPVNDEPLNVQVTLTADPVVLRIRIQVPEIDPVVVPIVTAAVPSIQELAARVLAIYADIGPTDLAVIVGCAKSTAAGMIQQWRDGRLTLSASTDGNL